MKKFIICCLILIIGHDGWTQKIPSNSLVVLENQKNPDIVSINQLWTNYLLSSPDSLYNNPYWNAKDKGRYKSYDLLRSEGYMALYGLAKYGELKNLVLSISPLDNGYYDIHSLYYWGHFTEYPYILCTTHVLAFKENDSFVLGNWLSYYSRNWKTIRKGRITFHYQKYKKNNRKIKKTIRFLSFLEQEFNIEIDRVDVYISANFRETQKLKGFGYDIGETALADSGDRDLGGTTDCDNNIIYSNSTEGEFYQHEMMRLIHSHYPKAYPLLLNGLSEYYSEDARMLGVTHKEHFKNLDRFLSSHPEINLVEFDSFDSGNMAQEHYLIGMIIVGMIEKQCGHDKLLDALRIVHGKEDLLLFLEKEFGILPCDVDSFLRGAIRYYSMNDFKYKTI